jgi:hypothetical protein
LEEHKGHRGRAAKALGIDPKPLYNKLKAGRPDGAEEDADSEARDRGPD